MANEKEKRVASEQQCMRRLTNNDLVCKTCEYVYDDSVKLGNTSKCAMYDVKPTKVLLGGECDEYKEQEST